MNFAKRIALFTLFFVGQAHADRPSVHGMLLFGDRTTYASHLPMYHAPHDYQFLFKAQLSGNETLPLYAQAKAAGHTLFTIEPEVMDLAPVMNGQRTVFTADLYDGHFERGGKLLGKVKITVTQIVLVAKLNADQLPSDHERFLIFGEHGEFYAAHVIGGRPNFDQIAKIQKLASCHSDSSTGLPQCDVLATDLPNPLTAIGPSRPLLDGEALTTTFGGPTSYRLTSGPTIYLEKGDLE